MRRQVVFHGRVQGVGFRATTVAAAGQFNVTGWVRNEPDGTVLLEAQGDAAEVERFLAELSTRMARYIRSSARVELPDDPGERGFAVRY